MNEKTCTSCRFYKEEHVHHQLPGSRFPGALLRVAAAAGTLPLPSILADRGCL